MADIIDADALRTEWHERAVIACAKARGDDPAAALAQSRLLRSFAKRDLRLTIREAKLVCEDGNCRRMFNDRRTRRAPQGSGS